MGLCELKASLVYELSSRTARADRETLTQKKKKKIKEKEKENTGEY